MPKPNIIMTKYVVLIALGKVVKGHPINDREKGGPLPPSYDDGSSLDALLILFLTFMGFLVVSTIVSVLTYCIQNRIQLVDEDNLESEDDNQAYLELGSEEQELYFQSKEYLQANPYLTTNLTLSQSLLVQEKGVNAWEFGIDPSLTANDLVVLNKYELNFFKNLECSAQTNLPIPKLNEVYYFESKIYSLPYPETTKISIGMAIKPYPFFRLPGRHHYSVSYDSDGHRRFNQPFNIKTEPVFPQLEQGDVIGIGYRTRSGTIFFTRNGKKLDEKKIGGHIKGMRLNMCPTIGANNLCSIHVNVGQMGYVFIEGNVKKWGFAPLEGNGPSPPAYNKFNGDILLERSEIDEENDLIDRENDFPPNFWDVADNDMDDDKFSYNVHEEYDDQDENYTLASLPQHPPSYNNSSDDEDVEGNRDLGEGHSSDTAPVTSPSTATELDESINSQESDSPDPDAVADSSV